MLFLGEYEHNLDQKQRLAIPAEIRDSMSKELHGEAFVAAPGANGALWLWPEKTFAQLSARLGQNLLGEEALVQFERLFFSQAARIPLDSAGRVRIPDRLLARYGLTAQVLVLGVRDHLEVVRPEEWRGKQQEVQPLEGEIWRRARAALATEPPK